MSKQIGPMIVGKNVVVSQDGKILTIKINLEAEELCWRWIGSCLTHTTHKGNKGNKGNKYAQGR